MSFKLIQQPSGQDAVIQCTVLDPFVQGGEESYGAHTAEVTLALRGRGWSLLEMRESESGEDTVLLLIR